MRNKFERNVPFTLCITGGFFVTQLNSKFIRISILHFPASNKLNVELLEASLILPERICLKNLLHIKVIQKGIKKILYSLRYINKWRHHTQYMIVEGIQILTTHYPTNFLKTPAVHFFYFSNTQNLHMWHRYTNHLNWHYIPIRTTFWEA